MSAGAMSLVPAPSVRARKRIVLLDDDLGMLAALERMLSRAGFHVLATHDAKRAIEAVVREGADAIISDLYMPEMGGNVVLAMIAKAAPRTARLLLTSETDFGAVATLSHPASIDAFIPKREASSRLVATLHELLGDRSRQDVSTAADARKLAVSIRPHAGPTGDFRPLPARGGLVRPARVRDWSLGARGGRCGAGCAAARHR